MFSPTAKTLLEPLPQTPLSPFLVPEFILVQLLPL